MDRRSIGLVRGSKDAGAISSSMEQKQGSESPWKLFVRQEIPPAANAGPHVADWIPDFAGFSWIAYGAGSRLVISVASSPANKDELLMGRLFQQVLDTSSMQVPVGDPRVLIISWSTADGHLAAAAGNIIYICAPKPLIRQNADENPALPFVWEPRSLLVHSSTTVSHFMWTGSADGILASAGLEILMWKQQDLTEWQQVWKFQVLCLQSLVASTWSFKGLAASADENSNQTQKGNATIWWWDEGIDLQAAELSHPRQVLGIQWRPVAHSTNILQQRQRRPVLLTICADGVIRLWLEIDSGKARTDKHSGKEVPEKSLKPAFFVSAVIEVNSSLQASLGIDCFVTWSSEEAVETSAGEAPACEWLIGVGPRGGITLWSLHCLDDIHPSRCPRVLLWRQGTCRLVDTAQDMFFEAAPSFKAVIQRSHRALPPALVDIFQTCADGVLRWSRVWPPISSIGGRSSITGSLDSTPVTTSTTWGCSSQAVYIGGHSDEEVRLAFHPVRTTCLAASSGKCGTVLLWYTGAALEPSLEFPGVNLSSWKLSGRIVGLKSDGKVVPALCWLPVQLPGGNSVLLVTQAEAICCYLISRGSADKGGLWLGQVMIHECRASPSSGVCFQAVSSVVATENCLSSFLLVAAGAGGRSTTSWRLNILYRSSEVSQSTDTPDVDEKPVISSNCLGRLSFLPGERVITFDASKVYDMISSCEGGSIRLWKLRGSKEENAGWDCVGQLKAHQEAVALAAVGDFGTRLALASSVQAKVTIWEMVPSVTFSYTPTGEILLSERASAIRWLEAGYGLPLLGVATGTRVQVYVEGRSQPTSWFCLASISLPSLVTDIFWGTRGALSVCSGSRIFILSYWLLSSLPAKSMQQILVVTRNICRPLSYCHPASIFHLLTNGELAQARASLRYLLLNITQDRKAIPEVQKSDLQKWADRPQSDSSMKTWEFGKTMEGVPADNISSDSLSTSEFQQLENLVGSLTEGPELIAIIKLLRETDQSAQFMSLDRPGQRFASMVLYNQFLSSQNLRELQAEPKAMGWALQSEWKDALLDMLIPGNLSWSSLRGLGAGYWFTDHAQLRTRIEKLARAQFLETRDPKDCALFYVALDRKNVLSGLFKLSKDESDKRLVEFFARNFQDEKNKSAALKNAYVLMGKHRYELAAAFFLLGGDLSSAVSVCSRNIGDPQLALVICRLVEGENSGTSKELIQNELLREVRLKDKWLASLLQCLLGERLQAVYELIGRDGSFDIFHRLDSDIGEYCSTILSKPGMASDAFASQRASQITVLSLRKDGLPLEAAELLSRALPATVKPRSQEEFAATNWISSAVGERIAKRFVEELILQYAMQLLQQHPMWSCITDSSAYKLEEDKVFQELVGFRSKLGIDMASTILSLAKASWHYGRAYFGHWLLSSVQAFLKVQSASPGIIHAEDTLRSYTEAAPELLCSTVLACGAAAGILQVILDAEWDVTKQDVSSHASYSDGVSEQIDGLVAFAVQVKKLSEDIPRDSATPYILLAIVLCLQAAWLKRQSKALLLLLRMITDAGLLAFDLSSWFLTAYEAKSIEPGFGSEADDDRWQVLGVVLWSQVLSLTRKQLSGVTEVSYSGFGRVSPRQSTVESFARLSLVRPSESSPEPAKPSTVAADGMGHALLSSLNCISSKFRRQLAVRMKGVSAEHPLNTVLWGSSNREATASLSKESSPFEELWKFLSVKVEACSALRLEGFDAVKGKQARWIITEGPSDAESAITPSSSASSSPRESLTRLARTFSVKGMIQARFNTKFRKPEEALHLTGDIIESISVNSCKPGQVVVASNHKGLVYLDLGRLETFSEAEDNLWSEADWPRNGWAGSTSTPLPTFVSPGVGLGSKGGSGIGLGGAAVGLAALPKVTKKSWSGSTGFGIPGYAGMAAWNMGWGEVGDFDDFVDPPATVENVSSSCTASHPLRPFFLVGAKNTHVYLWKFGTSSAVATYGILPAANVPPPYALASVSSVQFDRYGHRFATSAVDGTVCTWQLEVGGRSNVCPTESYLCFDRHAADIAFVGGSGAIVAATGSSKTGENLVIWNTLAPPGSARVSVVCHQGGARCLDVFDHDFGGGGSPLIVSGGKGGDICVHDFRCITTGKSKRRKNGLQQPGGLVWRVPKAHSASVTKVRVVPGTSLFLTGSKDGDVKLWDVNKTELVNHWQRVHEKHTFLQPSTGFGALHQAPVTELRVLGDGFISCGGDGYLRRFRLREGQEGESLEN